MIKQLCWIALLFKKQQLQTIFRIIKTKWNENHFWSIKWNWKIKSELLRCATGYLNVGHTVGYLYIKTPQHHLFMIFYLGWRMLWFLSGKGKAALLWVPNIVGIKMSLLDVSICLTWQAEEAVHHGMFCYPVCPGWMDSHHQTVHRQWLQLPTLAKKESKRCLHIKAFTHM